MAESAVVADPTEPENMELIEEQWSLIKSTTEVLRSEEDIRGQAHRASTLKRQLWRMRAMIDELGRHADRVEEPQRKRESELFQDIMS